jgi:acyl carrier protein
MLGHGLAPRKPAHKERVLHGAGAALAGPPAGMEEGCLFYVTAREQLDPNLVSLYNSRQHPMKSTLDLRREVGSVVKEIIISIKPLDGGLEDFPDDAPLFSGAEASPVELDSLDGLDLALSIGEKFGLDFGADVDIESFQTVNDIVDFILSSASPTLVTEGLDTHRK